MRFPALLNGNVNETVSAFPVKTVPGNEISVIAGEFGKSVFVTVWSASENPGRANSKTVVQNMIWQSLYRLNIESIDSLCGKLRKKENLYFLL
jgi:hypothetical protein